MKNKGKIERHNLGLVDVYSLGVIYFELLALLNHCTHHERTDKLQSLQHNRVELPQELKEEKKLIKLLTRTNNRPSLQEVQASRELRELRGKYPQP